MFTSFSFRTSLLLFAIFFNSILNSQTQNNEKTFYVASWNIENLFDTIDDPVKNDSEFLPESDKQWTDDKFQTKLTNLAKVINYMNEGCGPDVLGLVEVENINVLKWLIYKFKDRDYIIVHRDSPDERGIDAALIYDRNIFTIDAIDTIKVILPTKYATRYILQAILIHNETSSRIHFFVNHWPSRRGGEVKSEVNRITAAKALKARVDSILKKNKHEMMIFMGDFNDEPNNKSIENILGASKFECNKVPKNKKLLNLSYHSFMKKEGSYKFGSSWDMIDQIIVSSSLMDSNGIEYVCNSYQVLKPDFMIAKTGNRKGTALPTYSGKLYLGGFSDHFPVGARFSY
jgi:endonuclease/exonuclease/phosphatase family metal-dependent hydrolase